VSPATICRRLAELERLDCFTRERRPGGRYRYQIAERFRLRWRPAAAVPRPKHRVSQRATRQAETSKYIEIPLDSEAFKWRARLRQLREQRLWCEAYGPLPGQPGCRVPAELLAGYAEQPCGSPT
jgi:hypothetical protein